MLIFETESDLTILDYITARQSDSETVHTWEVAGTAHADAYLISVASGLPRDPGLGVFLECDFPINDGPQHEVLQAAVRSLVE